MGSQGDLFASVDPAEKAERALRDELATCIAKRAFVLQEDCDLRAMATELGGLVASLARGIFSTEEDEKVRSFALEASLVLVAHVGRSLSPGEVEEAAADLARRLAATARRRFSPQVSKLKKST